MAIHRTADTEIRLVSGDAVLRIAAKGAELVGWTVADAPLLWQPDPAVWDRTSPVLFPIVGRARDRTIRVNGRAYEMGIHGFAAASTFAVVEQSADQVCLRLTDDDATRARYPFAFRLDVAYRLTARGLDIAFEVANTGDRVMPYALGFHPGFRWPLSGRERQGHVVTFAEAEEPRVPVITAAGLFSPDRRTIPLDGRTLALTDELMSNEALCFLDARSRSLEYASPAGASLTMSVDDFPHFALWTRPPALFLCIEAWTGHGDPDGYDGELADKPSMRLLPPGGVAHHVVAFAYRRARET